MAKGEWVRASASPPGQGYYGGWRWPDSIEAARAEEQMKQGAQQVEAHSGGQPSLAQTLAERGARYGDFSTHAKIAQQLKMVVLAHCSRLRPVHLEALDIIMHKIARILNGDPEYADSWHDIAGYAKLAEDRCEPGGRGRLEKVN